MKIQRQFALVFGGIFCVACSAAHDPKAGSTNSASTAATSTTNTEWCHDDLAANDNATTFNFDYQVTSTSSEEHYSSSASPGWLNVWNSTFTGSESVQGVVTVFTASNYEITNTSSWGQTNVVQVPLTWNGSNFTGPIASLPLTDYTEGDDEYMAYAYQFSVVVNGTWLTDPVTGTHNFQYVPTFQASDGSCGKN